MCIRDRASNAQRCECRGARVEMRCGGHAEAFESAPAIGLARCRQTARPRIANVDRLERDTSSNECRRQTRDRTTVTELSEVCLLYTSPSPRDRQKSRM